MMNDLQFYNEVCSDLSILLTSKYSTSFSSGIRLFDIETRRSICSIYGFVRLADEIVDSFHSIDKFHRGSRLQLPGWPRCRRRGMGCCRQRW